jgi:hypothetical protein
MPGIARKPSFDTQSQIVDNRDRMSRNLKRGIGLFAEKQTNAQADHTMYRIDKANNKIEALEEKQFSELGFTERKHLQEWLAGEPGALGEELLIIQKEFDGFDETSERLDLLALDKLQRLVIIENKLDSGRDVVWQALKYASYCSSLKRDQIVDIFQRYLDRNGGGSAREKLIEFFDGKEIEELKLNAGNTQRVFLVATRFRKEVTSTAMWLLSHGIAVKCFKVAAYGLESNVLFRIDQVIPMPEAAEYMIGLAEKEAAEHASDNAYGEAQNLRFQFWTQALKAVKDSGCRLFDGVTPSPRGTAGTGAGIAGLWYEMKYRFEEIRVRLYIDKRESSEANKRIFDELFAQKNAIESKFGAQLDWNRMDDAKASAITYSRQFDGRDQANWPAMIEWLVTHMPKLEAAIQQPLLAVRQKGGK